MVFQYQSSCCSCRYNMSNLKEDLSFLEPIAAYILLLGMSILPGITTPMGQLSIRQNGLAPLAIRLNMIYRAIIK